MIGHWAPEAESYRLAAALFEHCMGVERILAGKPPEQRRISTIDLFGYLDDPNFDRSQAVATALRLQPRLQDDFDHLMRRTARYAFPRLAAASSGQVTARTIDGCRITLKRSQADSTQVYVIIAMDDPDAAPHALFICTSRGAHVRHPLPEAVDGRLQLLAEESSELIAGLRDIEAEVFLR